MTSDADLRDLALAEFRRAQDAYHLTTQGYLKNPKGTNWKRGDSAFAKGMEYLSQIASEPPPPAGFTLPRYGIANGYSILRRTQAERRRELDLCVEAGAKWVRFDSTPGNQALCEPCVNDALERGLTVMLILFGTTDPLSATVAADFATQQATRWKGQNVCFEFCNEPDLHGWGGATYGIAAQAAGLAIKAVDPSIYYVVGALWKCESLGTAGMGKFVQAMYQTTSVHPWDAVSVHLYDAPAWADERNGWRMCFGPETPNVRQVMDSFGDEDVPILATEAGATVTQVSEAEQAARITAQMADPRCKAMAVYTMLDDDVAGFGLLRPDGTKRPAWDAYVGAA